MSSYAEAPYTTWTKKEITVCVKRWHGQWKAWVKEVPTIFEFYGDKDGAVGALYQKIAQHDADIPRSLIPKHTYRITQRVEDRFALNAIKDMMWLCGEHNVELEKPTNEEHKGMTVVKGVYTGHPETFESLKFNWSQVGTWEEEMIDERTNA